MLPHFLTVFKNSIRQIKEKSAIFLHFCFWGCLKFKQKSFFLGFLELFMCDDKKMVRPPEPSGSRLKTVFESIGAYGFIGGGSWNRPACEDEDRPPTKEMVELEAKRTKNVLVLMSDTGGGHRASAEAIRDAFKIEFGDQYRVQFLVIDHKKFVKGKEGYTHRVIDTHHIRLYGSYKVYTCRITFYTMLWPHQSVSVKL